MAKTYHTVPYTADMLPPNAEASSGPMWILT